MFTGLRKYKKNGSEDKHYHVLTNDKDLSSVADLQQFLYLKHFTTWGLCLGLSHCYTKRAYCGFQWHIYKCKSGETGQSPW